MHSFTAKAAWLGQGGGVAQPSGVLHAICTAPQPVHSHLYTIPPRSAVSYYGCLGELEVGRERRRESHGAEAFKLHRLVKAMRRSLPGAQGVFKQQC